MLSLQRLSSNLISDAVHSEGMSLPSCPCVNTTVKNRESIFTMCMKSKPFQLRLQKFQISHVNLRPQELMPPTWHQLILPQHSMRVHYFGLLIQIPKDQNWLPGSYASNLQNWEVIFGPEKFLVTFITDSACPKLTSSIVWSSPFLLNKEGLC